MHRSNVIRGSELGALSALGKSRVFAPYVGPVIVIVGPTASGKTGVAIEAALEIEQCLGRKAEIISADSRTVYKHMDIGTAKPTLTERKGVVHHGFDLVEPGERWTVADWKAYAEGKIAEVRKRGNVPIICGGTGLYIDALIYNYRFERSGEQKSCADREAMESGFEVVGIRWETEELRKRIVQRIDKMFVQELFDEVNFLVQKCGWDNQAMKSDVYEYAWKYMQGELELDEAKKMCFYEDWHLAKRQMTWFKRNKNIKWMRLENVVGSVLKCIQDE